jgi:hypothetical protein
MSLCSVTPWSARLQAGTRDPGKCPPEGGRYKMERRIGTK